MAQIWRDDCGRQASLARLLARTGVVAVDAGLVRRGRDVADPRGHADAINVTVVCLAADRDDILTSDPGDLRPGRGLRIHVDLIPA